MIVKIESEDEKIAKVILPNGEFFKILKSEIGESLVADKQGELVLIPRQESDESSGAVRLLNYLLGGSA